MENNDHIPLLLLDNSSMMSVLNEGTFKCENITFDEARGILDTFAKEDVLRCFNNQEIETIMYDYLKIERKDFPYKKIRNMRPNQGAIVFKLYTAPSKTQPVIQADDGVEAKKIQNVYIYCQYLIRLA